MVGDILFNVVFGQLTSHDVGLFLNHTTLYEGLGLQLMCSLRDGGNSQRGHARDLGAGISVIRQHLVLLRGAGFVQGLGDELSEKGTVFLDLVRRIAVEQRSGRLSHELLHVLRLLKAAPPRRGDARRTSMTTDPAFTNPWVTPYEALLYQMAQISKLRPEFDPGPAPVWIRPSLRELYEKSRSEGPFRWLPDRKPPWSLELKSAVET